MEEIKTDDVDLEVTYIPLGEIQYADKNPKDHDIGQIYESIRRFGFVSFPLVNKSTMKLLAGHGRTETLKIIKKDGEFVPKNIKVAEDGSWLVPCMVSADIDNEAEAQAYLLADNRLVELGGYNTLDLIESLQEVITETGSLDGTGYELEDIEDILNDLDRTSFEVRDYGEGSANDDETTVVVKVGRYEQKVPVEDFYEWEQVVKNEIGNSENNSILVWIRNSLLL